MKKVLKVNSALREEFDKAFEKEIGSQKNKTLNYSERLLAETRFRLREGKEKDISSEEMNFLYRICLARHGVKPENLVK